MTDIVTSAYAALDIVVISAINKNSVNKIFMNTCINYITDMWEKEKDQGIYHKTKHIL